MKKKTKAGLLCTAAAAAVFLCAGLYQGLAVRFYSIETDKVHGRVRIALITDLHACLYGEGQRELLAAISDCAPDLILLGGDFFDDHMPDRNAVLLLDGLRGGCPVFYVTGNHEYRCDPARFRGQMEQLSRHGVRRLSGEALRLSLPGGEILLCGVDDPDAYQITAQDKTENQASFWRQLQTLQTELDGGTFSVLLSHRPEYISLYEKAGFDLALCGHAHGGQWRIPGLMNGFYAPNQGMFPRHAGGEYRSGGTAMIVSRGLARETTLIPRFYNRPELVIADLV